MSESAVCSQKGCGQAPFFRYTWPGRGEALVCVGHARSVRNVARAMGLYVQLVPLTATPEGARWERYWLDAL